MTDLQKIFEGIESQKAENQKRAERSEERRTAEANYEDWISRSPEQAWRHLLSFDANTGDIESGIAVCLSYAEYWREGIDLSPVGLALPEAIAAFERHPDIQHPTDNLPRNCLLLLLLLKNSVDGANDGIGKVLELIFSANGAAKRGHGVDCCAGEIERSIGLRQDLHPGCWDPGRFEFSIDEFCDHYGIESEITESEFVKMQNFSWEIRPFKLQNFHWKSGTREAQGRDELFYYLNKELAVPKKWRSIGMSFRNSTGS
jgi:hypothetical protein